LAFLERSNIEYVQRFGDQHIVKLIKAYGYGETINFIFPRAWTDLDHLLRDRRFGYGEKRGAKLELANAWKQLLGISRALKQIQGFANGADSRGGGNVEDRLCIHSDLKPDNILIEREGGNWLITDFGQAALTQRRHGTPPHVGDHSETDAYAPPEIEDTTMNFGRAYDIWSLGCIMLEVTAFMVLGYAGLKGEGSFTGLDQVRRAMPGGTRNSDERFFCRDVSNEGYVVKKEIVDFMTNLERSHARSQDSSEQSKVFLRKVLELISRMLKPNAKDRMDMNWVVETLSSASKRALIGDPTINTHRVMIADDETVLGGPQLNKIELRHCSTANSEWEASNLEALESEAGIMRLHCWSHRESMDISFRRSHVKILPHYAFWDPHKSYDFRKWIDFSYLSANRRSSVPNATFSFDGDAGLEEARIVQSKLTSQAVVGSFQLNRIMLNRMVSVGAAVKNLWQKVTTSDGAPLSNGNHKSLEFGTATIQVWAEQRQEATGSLARRESLVSPATSTDRAVRKFEGDQRKVPPCRVVIYSKRHNVLQ
jgi:serine/threonine protein kinase